MAVEVGAFFLVEFPEDLGVTDTGVPASIWQMRRFSDHLARRGMRTFALFQCEFGASSQKPTRFLSDLEHFEGNIYFGIPTFDRSWRYQGPLPRTCPHAGQHEPLIGTNPDGSWKTTPAAHYPGPLCAFLSQAIYKTWVSTSSVSKGVLASDVELDMQGPEMGEQLESKQQPEDPKVDIQSGCRGPPLTATYAGRSEPFCDGLGLCSAGRWHPNLRQQERTVDQQRYSERVAALIDSFCRRKLGDLAKATLKLALGRFQQSPFTESDIEELRQEWFRMLPDPATAKERPGDQPFLLHALAQSLRLMGDPDTEIIDGGGYSSFVQGVHIGHQQALGPTPQVYRPRIKEPVYDDSAWDLSMDNYFKGTEEEAERILESHFREEELDGRMAPISEKEAAQRFPGDALRIAAQGILDKPDGGHRIIHDGTHGVKLNNEIQVLDRLENPGPRELASIMKLSEDSQERVIFAINGDIAKAHRRVKVRPSDWGVQACRTSSRSKVVWLNKVGTFGVASAAYWWSRLMGLVGRHALNLMGTTWFFVLVFVDDLHLASGGPDRWINIWRYIVALELVGTPFSYKKFRGGFTVDFVGYWLDYARFELGISEKRTNWLVEFINQMERDGWLVMSRRYQEFHGRLGFTAQVLPWLRPLLAPGYSWLAAVGKNSTLKLPELLVLVCTFIRYKFVGGLRKIPCLRDEIQLGEWFRTDAKCEPGRVVLGGWALGKSGNSKEAPWFSLELHPGVTPWLFRGEGMESSWASTTAELLASLVALKVFELPNQAKDHRKAMILKCGGGTDNKAASQLVRKRLSTKWPVMIVLMDFLNFCEERRIRCQLDWRPRDTNVEADDLTNGVFGSFSLERRLEVSWSDLEFPMIELLMSASESFSKRKFDKMDVGARTTGAKFSKTAWG